MRHELARRIRQTFDVSLAIGALAVVVGCGGGTAATGAAGSGPSGAAGVGPSGAAGVGSTGAGGVGPSGAGGVGPSGAAGVGGSATGSGAAGGGLASRPKPMGAYTVGTPSAPGPWAATPVTTGAVPVIVYPSSETRFPRNIYRTLFQWKGQGMSEFRLSFVGTGSQVTVYSNGQHADCTTAGSGCWEADEESWFLIAYGNAGQTVQVTVDGLDTTTQPATVRRSQPITIGFSKQDVTGAIFYWSTTSAGIRRANIAASRPEDYITGKPSTTYANPADQVKCVACHVVSRDGKYMVAPVDAASGKSLWVMEVTKDAPPNPLVKKIANTDSHGFATISPDDATVIAAFMGKMWTVDRATGAFGANLPLGTLKATHPDWSPDGKQVVFATAAGDAPAGAALATIPFQNGQWGTPQTLVPPPMNGNKVAGTNLFPMHSPDGKWVAFTRGVKGGHGDLSYQLWTTPAAGGAPVELVNANRVVSNAVTDGLHENAQPTWAPPGDFHWVAFNSVRPYGVVLPKGTQQIWVAAVDPAKLAQGGVDPSYPAFRLQFQGLKEDNHRAYWTLDVRYPDQPPPPPPPTDGGEMCVPEGERCDLVDYRCCASDSRCDTMDDGKTYICGLW
jgi:hypothetical protein